MRGVGRRSGRWHLGRVLVCLGSVSEVSRRTREELGEETRVSADVRAEEAQLLAVPASLRDAGGSGEGERRGWGGELGTRAVQAARGCGGERGRARARREGGRAPPRAPRAELPRPPPRRLAPPPPTARPAPPARRTRARRRRCGEPAPKGIASALAAHPPCSLCAPPLRRRPGAALRRRFAALVAQPSIPAPCCGRPTPKWPTPTLALPHSLTLPLTRPIQDGRECGCARRAGND